jgi:HemX protein
MNGPSERILFWAALVCYAGGFAVGVGFLRRQLRYPRWLMTCMAGAGFILQTAALIVRGASIGHCPLGNPFELLQFVTWSLVLIYLIVGPAFRIGLLGFFSAGLASVLSLSSLIAPAWDAPYTANIFQNDPLIESHAAIAAFSYGAFGLLALTSTMYLLQSWTLQSKQRGTLPRFLPSIVELDAINFRLLIVAEAMLTFGLVLGVLVWQRGPIGVTPSKLLLTTGIWLAYGVAVLLRVQCRLVAKHFAWALALLFLLALITLGVVGAEPLSVR